MVLGWFSSASTKPRSSRVGMLVRLSLCLTASTGMAEPTLFFLRAMRPTPTAYLGGQCGLVDCREPGKRLELDECGRSIPAHPNRWCKRRCLNGVADVCAT